MGVYTSFASHFQTAFGVVRVFGLVAYVLEQGPSISGFSSRVYTMVKTWGYFLWLQGLGEFRAFWYGLVSVHSLLPGLWM